MAPRRLRVGFVVVALLVVAPSTAAGADAGTEPAAPTAESAEVPRFGAPSVRGGSWVAKILIGTSVRSAPGRGRTVWRATPRIARTHSPQQLMVVGPSVWNAAREWIPVQLPLRPNERIGWVSADAVRVQRSSWYLQVRIGERRLLAWHRGRVVRRSRVVVGAAATPTPRGLFAVQEVVAQRDPAGFLGPWALHLTAHSNVLFDYGGGQGRAAIHGRGGKSLLDPLGSARSNGCVRIDNRDVRWLAARIRPGTPVEIVR
jgi:lipoprotein-anchoring transpeptidase ErfK/SrfK